MKKLILALGMLCVLATSQGQAQTVNVPSCDNVPRSQWAKCIIERSQDGNGQ